MLKQPKWRNWCSRATVQHNKPFPTAIYQSQLITSRTAIPYPSSLVLKGALRQGFSIEQPIIKGQTVSPIGYLFFRIKWSTFIVHTLAECSSKNNDKVNEQLSNSAGKQFRCETEIMASNLPTDEWYSAKRFIPSFVFRTLLQPSNLSWS